MHHEFTRKRRNGARISALRNIALDLEIERKDIRVDAERVVANWDRNYAASLKIEEKLQQELSK